MSRDGPVVSVILCSRLSLESLLSNPFSPSPDACRATELMNDLCILGEIRSWAENAACARLSDDNNSVLLWHMSYAAYANPVIAKLFGLHICT